jgi:hypothetical protein
MRVIGLGQYDSEEQLERAALGNKPPQVCGQERTRMNSPAHHDATILSTSLAQCVRLGAEREKNHHSAATFWLWNKLTVIRVSAVLTALLCSFAPPPALAQCYIPHPGTESVGWVLTDVNSGAQITNGMVIPASTGTIKFHEYGTANGSCDVYTTGCSQYATTVYRNVNHLYTEVLARSSSLNGTYSWGYVFGKNPSTGATEFYQSLDDSDTADSTGPIADFVTFVPGTFQFTLTNIINFPWCPTPMPPTSVATTITVSYHGAACSV